MWGSRRYRRLLQTTNCALWYCDRAKQSIYPLGCEFDAYEAARRDVPRFAEIDREWPARVSTRPRRGGWELAEICA